jgi:hypothetical protein
MIAAATIVHLERISPTMETTGKQRAEREQFDIHRQVLCRLASMTIFPPS